MGMRGLCRARHKPRKEVIASNLREVSRASDGGRDVEAPGRNPFSSVELRARLRRAFEAVIPDRAARAAVPVSTRRDRDRRRAGPYSVRLSFANSSFLGGSVAIVSPQPST